MVMWRKTASDVNDAKVPNITVTMKMNWRAEKKNRKKTIQKVIFGFCLNGECSMLNVAEWFETIHYDFRLLHLSSSERWENVSSIVYSIYLCVRLSGTMQQCAPFKNLFFNFRKKTFFKYQLPAKLLQWA